MAAEMDLSLEGSFGVRRVSVACCVIGSSIFAVGGFTYDDLYGRSALSNDVSTWTSEYGWRHLRLPADSPAPAPRAGHTCCAREQSVLVFGGYAADATKLADLWELRTVGSLTLYELELGVEAVLTAAEQEADLALRQKATGKQAKGVVEELEPLALFDMQRFRTAIETALELPTEAITIAEPTIAPDRPGKLAVKVLVEPLIGVGIQAYGVNGVALPRAALTRMRDQLRAAGVQEGMAEVPVDSKAAAALAKKDKGATGAAPKGGGKPSSGAEAAEPAVVEARPPPPELGFALKSWALHETEVPVPGALSWRQWVPAESSKTVPPRSGHTADVAEGFMWVFGGSGPAGGPLAELTSLELASLEWVPQEVSGKAPAPRMSHASCALQAEPGSSVPALLVVCGGSDGKRRLADLWVLELGPGKRVWVAVVDPSKQPVPQALPAPYPLHAAWHTMTASGGRIFCFGGLGAKDEALDSLAILQIVSASDEAGTGTAPTPADAKYQVRTRTLSPADGAGRLHPAPRFSHGASPLPQAGAEPMVGVLIFGGTSATAMLEDCWQIRG